MIKTLASIILYISLESLLNPLITLRKVDLSLNLKALTKGLKIKLLLDLELTKVIANLLFFRVAI